MGSSRFQRAALLLIALLMVFFWLEHLHLALEKFYNIDEFQYAHGAWKIAQGEVIYRDFFEHHFPFIHQVGAAVFVLFGDEDPGNLIYLRLLMLPFLTLTLGAAWWINRRSCGGFALLTPLFLLMVPTFSAMATEVRPDPLAVAFFLSALAVLYSERLSPHKRGFLSGALAVAALWSTLKVAYYGLIFPIALLADLLARREGKKDFLLGHPFAFLLGGATAALPIVAYLTVTASWGAWFEWCIRWSFVHQLHYPGFFWTRNFTQLLAQSFWLFPLAAVGVASTLRSRPSPGSPDWLLLGSLITTLASFAWQSAAYLYSLIPFTAVLALFAGRGFVAALRFTRGRQQVAGAFATLLLLALAAVELQRARTGLLKLRLRTNAEQHALLGRVHALTRPDEPVLNIAGGQITRPSVHFFYFFEAVVRQLKHDVFAYELPPSLTEKGAVAYMPSDRFGRLPEPLRRFLLDHFQPYDRELWFWGQRFSVPMTGLLQEEFVASRAGRYFVWPLSVPESGALRVGEEVLSSPIFELEAGRHTVSYRGGERELVLTWLPADGRPFEPRPELQPGLAGYP